MKMYVERKVIETKINETQHIISERSNRVLQRKKYILKLKNKLTR